MRGKKDGIRRAPVHRRTAGHSHARLGRSGHFWQGRFGCVAMNEEHLGAALRYVVLDPVRAGLVPRAVDWRWSSTPVLLGRVETDGLTTAGPVLSRYPDFSGVLAAGEDEATSMPLRRAEQIGRPIGGQDFLDRLERQSNRTLAPAKRGRKPAKSALSP